MNEITIFLAAASTRFNAPLIKGNIDESIHKLVRSSKTNEYQNICMTGYQLFYKILNCLCQAKT
jgi:hypothetical protein